MFQPPIFDTLKYARMLKEKGINHSDDFSRALSDALGQDIYSKREIERMFEAALQEFRQSNREIKEDLLRTRLELEREISKVRVEIHSSMNRAIGVLGSLIVVVGAIVSFSHYFIH